MLKLLNRYCSICLRTQRFLDLGSHLVCECCSKRLERVRPAAVTAEPRIVTWAERAEQPVPRRSAAM